MEYFVGGKSVDKTMIRNIFEHTKWLENPHAVKFTMLFFIEEYLFSYENSEQSVSKKHFYLVESGIFNEYPWGIDIFQTLLDSIRHTLKISTQYYRLGGFPLALQTWIYECCPFVDESIAICTSKDKIPRVLRWKVISDAPRQAKVEKLMFTMSHYKFTNISASDEEISMLMLPDKRDYNLEMLTIMNETSATGSNQAEVELIKELRELKLELIKTNSNQQALEDKVDEHLKELKQFVIDSNPKLLTNIKSLFKKEHENESVPNKQDFEEPLSRENRVVVPPVFANLGGSGKSDIPDFNKGDVPVEKVFSSVLADITYGGKADMTKGEDPVSIVVSSVLADVQDGGEADDFFKGGDPLGVVADVVDDNEAELDAIFEILPDWGGVTKVGKKPISTLDDFEMPDNLTQHPFSIQIGVEVDTNLINSFTIWLNEGLSKKRRKSPYLVAAQELKPPLHLGIALIKEKDWFYNLAHSGQQWKDTHIDVILYYLRKKGKYGPSSDVKFTTTDCGFKIKMEEIFFKLVAANEEKSGVTVKATDSVAGYISGTSLIGAVSWDVVDLVLISVNLKKNHHWILIVFDIAERSLNVYDSFPKRGKDYELSNIVEMFSAMLPLYLDITKFFEKRVDLLSTPKYSKLKVTDKLHINMLTDHLPKQKEDSLVCGFLLPHLLSMLVKNDRFHVRPLILSIAERDLELYSGSMQ